MGSLMGLVASLERPLACEDLFDAIPDTVFFVKDAVGRYVAVNRTLAERTRFGRKEALIGLTADVVFPGDLGRRITEQDRAILADARSLKGELELHLHANGEEGWCLTWKEPLFDRERKVVGLVGLSRDLRMTHVASGETATLSDALRFAQCYPHLVTKASDLAFRAALSPFQLDQRIRVIFGISARQYLIRLRVDFASDYLQRTDEPISQIAIKSGYAEQSSFTRQFKKTTGVSPSHYRRIRKQCT